MVHYKLENPVPESNWHSQIEGLLSLPLDERGIKKNRIQLPLVGNGGFEPPNLKIISL